MRINRTGISVTGVNRTRLLKTLVADGVNLENIYNEPQNPLKFTIKSTDKAKTFAILKKLCYNYTVEWDYGVKSLAKIALSRMGLFVGLALAATICVIISRSVLFIRVTKVEELDENEIVCAVKSVAPVPTFRDRLQVDEIRRKVESINGVALCNVSVRGNSIIVEAIGASNRQETHVKNEIISEYDAVVTKIVAKRGTAVKHIGDIVKKGELLISGNVMSSDGTTVVRTVVPEGEVWGRVALHESALIPETVVVKKRTGKSKTFSFLTFGNRLPIATSPYKISDSVVETAVTGIFIPLKFTKITYYETEFVDEKTNPDKEAQKIADRLSTSAAGTLLDTKITVTPKENGITRIGVYVIAERKISA